MSYPLCDYCVEGHENAADYLIDQMVLSWRVVLLNPPGHICAACAEHQGRIAKEDQYLVMRLLEHAAIA